MTSIAKKYGAELKSLREGKLEKTNAEAIFKEIGQELKDGSSGARALNEILRKLAHEDDLYTSELRAEVWQRDPWVDLTHQEEFFSSASLRGVKLVGRGPKGRLGTFGYLRNKSISALDFRTKNGRIVRARIGAVTAKINKETEAPVLFVDGVEGSNKIPPKLIRHAIENFARECGFTAVAYNQFVHNEVPKRFVRHVRRADTTDVKINLEYVDSSTREYLDAFASPVEPFEYSYPRGKVICALKELEPSHEFETESPTKFDRYRSELKRKVLWLIAAEATVFAGGVCALSAPWAIPLIAGGAVAGFLFQRRHDLRAMRSSGQ